MPMRYDPSDRALLTPERSDTLFHRDHAYSPVQLAIEAARLAYYRAEDSESEKARLVEALARAGFKDAELFVDSASGGAAFGARRDADGTVILAFRGTRPDSIKNLLTDARANLVPWPESAGRVHSGFATAARSLLPRISQRMESTRPDPNNFILAGHSLGAALATLTATTCRPAWLVTLGSPRVGDAAFAATVRAAKTVRLVDCCDLVTEMPPPIDGYEHIRPPTYLTASGRVIENPADELVAKDRRHARLRYALRFSWRFWRDVAARDLADDAPINCAHALVS